MEIAKYVQPWLYLMCRLFASSGKSPWPGELPQFSMTSCHEWNFGGFDRISLVSERRSFTLKTPNQGESLGLDSKNIKDGGHYRNH